jgi:hypothetical protein
MYKRLKMLITERNLKRIIFQILNEVKREKDDSGNYIIDKEESNHRQPINPDAIIPDATDAAEMMIKKSGKQGSVKLIKKEKDLCEFLESQEGKDFLDNRFGPKGPDNDYRESVETTIDLLYEKPKNEIEKVMRKTKISFLAQTVNAYKVYFKKK